MNKQHDYSPEAIKKHNDAYNKRIMDEELRKEKWNTFYLILFYNIVPILSVIGLIIWLVNGGYKLL